MTQLILHLWGDYITQSSWMAMKKSKRAVPCLIHCLIYTIPFTLLTRDWRALAVIGVTHFLIDRYGLAKYLVWLKNWMQPGGYYPWRWCRWTGYLDNDLLGKERSELKAIDREELELADSDEDESRPIWIRVMLLIVADNTVHLTLNALALYYFG